MRNPNSASQILYGSNRSLMVALSAAALMISLCGCTPVALQQQPPVSFAPSPPRAATAKQQESINEILKRQDEMRAIKAQEEAAKAEAEAAAKAAEEAGQPTEQQQDVTSSAAARALPSIIDEVISVPELVETEPSFQVTQVSYETETYDEPTEQLQSAFNLQSITDFASEEPEAAEPIAAEPVESTIDQGVRLLASVDDLEGVPNNIARREIPYSTNNLLRTEDDLDFKDNDFRIAAVPATKVTQDDEWSVPEPIAQPITQPLSSVTQATKPALTGTLRPLAPASQKIEPTATVQKSSLEVPSFGPLSPLRPSPQSIKLTTPKPTAQPAVAPIAATQLLRPIVSPQPAVTWNPPVARTPQVAPNDFAAREIQTPAVVSEQVIEVDRPAPPKQEFKPQQDPEYPIVDASLAAATASYLHSDTKQEEALIPVDVIEEADAVAREFEEGLRIAAIPVERFEAPNNDFKVVTADQYTDRGKPLTENNDFAAPESPGGDFVAPMTITPIDVPTVVQGPLAISSSDFGKPVDLKAPPETNSFIARVAALPTNGTLGNGPKSKIPPVGVSTLMELDSVTWKTRLDEAIELAQQRLDRMKQPADSELVNVRLLKALRSQMQQMEDSPPGAISTNEAQYWQHQLEAITAMLGNPASNGNQAITDFRRHQTAHKTLEHLRHAVSKLESMASLKVTSGQFCTEITGFGQFRTFASNEFSPGQKMLVYCEVENYRTMEHPSTTGNDFHTRLRGSFAIYDSNGKVVQQAEYPTVDDIARKRRRDFYMYMPVTLGDLPAGQYVLHALVEDVHGNKTASLDPPLPFSVK